MNNQKILPSTGKYKNARLALLMVLIFSVLNLVTLFMEMYFLFSSYLALTFAEIGLLMQIESGESIYAIVGIILAVVVLVPFFLSWLLSKKRVGWMIVGLVLFSIDTALLLIDVPAYLSVGEFSIFIDLIIHAVVIVYLALGVKAGYDLKKEEKEAKERQAQVQVDAVVTPSFFEVGRKITVTRKKSYAGCAMKMTVYINDKEVAKLKIGESVTVDAPISAFDLAVALGGGMSSAREMVQGGDTNLSYSAKVKMGAFADKIELTKE